MLEGSAGGESLHVINWVSYCNFCHPFSFIFALIPFGCSFVLNRLQWSNFINFVFYVPKQNKKTQTKLLLHQSSSTFVKYSSSLLSEYSRTSGNSTSL